MGYHTLSKRKTTRSILLDAARAIDWDEFPPAALNSETPLYEWFTDGVVNTCYNALDRHAGNGRGDRWPSSMIARSQDAKAKPPTNRTRSRALPGNALKGITTGDRVIIYMPMITEALVAMLAHVLAQSIRLCSACCKRPCASTMQHPRRSLLRPAV